jgi:hypothetical protein
VVRALSGSISSLDKCKKKKKKKKLYLVAFEVITAVAMKGSIFWNIRPCSQLKTDTSCYLFDLGFFLSLILDPEDRSYIFLRNTGCTSTDYTALYPRK